MGRKRKKYNGKKNPVNFAIKTYQNIRKTPTKLRNASQSYPLLLLFIRYLLFVIISSGALFLALLTGELIHKGLLIKNVIVISQENIVSGLDYLEGKPLLFVDVGKLRQELLENNPQVSSIYITKHYPSELVLRFESRDPLAYINYQQPGSFKSIFIDKDGALFFIANHNISKVVPEIELSGNLVLYASRPDWRLSKIAGIIFSFSNQSIKINKLFANLSRGKINIILNDGILVKASLESNPWVLADSLQIILYRFRIEGKNIKEVDFLYDKPTVVIKGSEKVTST